MKKTTIRKQAGTLRYRTQTITANLRFVSADITLMRLNKGQLQIQSTQETHDLFATQTALLTARREYRFKYVDYGEISLWEWNMQTYRVAASRDCFLLDLNDLERELLKAMDQSQRHPYATEWMITLSDMLLLSLLAHPGVSVQLYEPAAERIDCEAINTYLQAHYDQHITLDEVAQHCHRNAFALSHLYKKQTGMTIFDALNRIRLAHALTLLRHSSLPVREIALQSGFSSTSYFIRRFARQYQLTPLQCRKQWLREQKASHPHQTYIDKNAK